MIKGMINMKKRTTIYRKHNCGGNIIDDKPFYIPIDNNKVLKTVNQICDKCKTRIIGSYQKKTILHDKQLHDNLIQFYRTEQNNNIK